MMYFLFIALAIPASFAGEDTWKQICEKYSHLEDHSVVTEELKDCSSYDLYYGIKQKQDFAAAKNCAYHEMNSEKDLVFGGPSILMMIYANGWGAKKDIDLALKYACKIEGAPAEMHSRIRHLEKLRNKKSNFDLCDDITSGFMQGYCRQVSADIAREKRRERWNEIQKKWSPVVIKTFHELEEAASTYIEIRTNNEVDLSGTARSVFMVEEQDHLETSFQGRVEKLERGTYAADYPDNDKILEETYEALLKKKKFYGTLSPEGVKKTQDAWLAYRKAWVKFAKVKYPRAKEIAKEITAERIAQLKDILENGTGG